jgi:hypothetical protein
VAVLRCGVKLGAAELRNCWRRKAGRRRAARNCEKLVLLKSWVLRCGWCGELLVRRSVGLAVLSSYIRSTSRADPVQAFFIDPLQLRPGPAIDTSKQTAGTAGAIRCPPTRRNFGAANVLGGSRRKRGAKTNMAGGVVGRLERVWLRDAATYLVHLFATKVRQPTTTGLVFLEPASPLRVLPPLLDGLARGLLPQWLSRHLHQFLGGERASVPESHP